MCQYILFLLNDNFCVFGIPLPEYNRITILGVSVCRVERKRVSKNAQINGCDSQENICINGNRSSKSFFGQNRKTRREQLVDMCG